MLQYSQVVSFSQNSLFYYLFELIYLFIFYLYFWLVLVVLTLTTKKLPKKQTEDYYYSYHDYYCQLSRRGVISLSLLNAHT